LQIEELRRQSETLQTELQAASKRQQSLEDSVSQAEAELHRSCEALEGALHEATEAQGDAKAAQQELVSMQAAMDALRKEHAQSEAASERLQAELAEARSQAHAAAEEADKLSAQADAWQALLDTRSSEKTALQAELATAQEAVASLRQRCLEAETKLADSLSQLSDLKTQLVQSNQEAASARTKCKELEQMLVEAETQLGNALASAATDRVNAQAASDALDSAGPTLAMLRESHAVLQREAAQHEAQCRELQLVNAQLDSGLADQQHAQEAEIASLRHRNTGAIQVTDVLAQQLVHLAQLVCGSGREDTEQLIARGQEQLQLAASGGDLADCLEALRAIAEKASDDIMVMMRDSKGGRAVALPGTKQFKVEQASSAVQASEPATDRDGVMTSQGQMQAAQTSRDSCREEQLQQALADEASAESKCRPRLDKQVCVLLPNASFLLLGCPH
jgi:chromosome segregation ATPase